MAHSLERLFSPGILDIIFPFIAFFFVIVLPMFFGFYVIYRVLSGKYSGEDKTHF